MGTNMEHVMTIANSIIGVSVLAMPFCFKQCGIILSILLLLLSGVMTRLACHYLLKAAINARRRNFEFLAFHVFGPTGKLCVELGVIGFMLGTCIAFFVVMGDLGPAIIGPAVNINSLSTLRPSVLIGIALLVVLPLGLLKNVDSLSAVCAASVAFYLCLVLKVMAEATTHLFSWDWVDKVNLWRPLGVPQCIPIFSMALSCQTQLFEIFNCVPNTSLEKMNSVIASAINICTAVYISVGFFGYIAFCTQTFSGNLLMSFSPTIASEVIKLGFVLSVAVSFPLVIFPCRASLNSLLFRRGHTPHHELLSGGGNYIPEPRFKCLTVFIVMFALGTGLLIPNIEVVLGLVGSTIGIIICILFPTLTFICVTNKNNNERLVAQLLFAFGIVIMVLGTYTNLYATEQALTKPDVEIQKIGLPPMKSPSDVIQLPPDTPDIVKDKGELLNENLIPKLEEEVKPLMPEEIKNEIPIEKPDEKTIEDSNKRKEPPIPVAPGDSDVKENSAPKAPPIVNNDKVEKTDEKKQSVDAAGKSENKNDGTISSDAIKKEDEEIKESAARNAEIQKKNEDLLEKLSKHEVEQKKIIEAQKELLEELKKQNQQQQQERKQDDNIDSKIKAVEQKIDNKTVPIKKIVKVEEMVRPQIDLQDKVNEVQKVDKVALKDKLEANKPVLKQTDSKNVLPLANKLAEGIPLPLAVKESEKIKKQSIPIAEASKESNANKKVSEKEKKPLDLSGKIDKLDNEREKRDIEYVIQSDTVISVNKKTAIDESNRLSSKLTKVSTQNNKTNDSVKQSIETVVKISNVESKNNHDNCATNENENTEPCISHIHKIEIDKIKSSNSSRLVDVQVEILSEKKEDVPAEESLIKSPVYISQPELPEGFAEGNINSENAVNPLKEIKLSVSRDLKSIDPNDYKEEE